ncbi:hypothetical protein FS749_013065 [Ceratobasidium sp. UAMH 11750]|nr:hypothetical protein FS749_013065 [Ceratobasidium sp. UAMH 11750]
MLNESVVVLLRTKAERSQAANIAHPEAGLLCWTDGDVAQVVLEPLEDEWTRRGQIVTSGLGGDQVGPKAARRPAESKKRPRKHLRSDNDPEDNDSETDSERKSFKKKSKSNSSGADPEEYDGFTYNREGF